MKYVFLILGLSLPTPLIADDNGAAFINQTIPQVMTVGQTAPAVITMRATTREIWSGATGYCLASQNPANNYTWGTNHICLRKEETVPQWDVRDFEFEIAAPAKPGVYSFQWRMTQDFVGWFGDPTPNSPIIVLGRNWLKRVYLDILGREPSVKEKETAVKLIVSGMAFSKIPYALFVSPDSTKTFTALGYRRLLSREPKILEAKAWKVEIVKSGFRTMLSTIAGSDEYYKAQGSTTKGFITGLYRDLLYSPPNDTFEQWVARVDVEKRSRKDVADDFMRSSWFLKNLVKQWYRKYLNVAEADILNDLEPWTTQLENGTRWEQVLSEIMASDDYQLGSKSKPQLPTRSIATEYIRAIPYYEP